MKIEDKVILVTGAGSGIGRELVLDLLSKRARVAGVDLNSDALAETARLAGSDPDRFGSFVADITERSKVEALPEQLLARFGAVDGVINNAGIIQPFSTVNDLDYPAIERVLKVNLMGTLFVTKALLPHLLKRPEAHIVNVSSMGGFIPVPGQTVYGAAKAAVKLLSEGLASELINANVRVTVVFPGGVATNITTNSNVSTPLSGAGSGRMNALPASKAAHIIIRGIERNAFHVFVGNDSRVMDKLYRLNPAYAARVIAKKMNALLRA